MAFNAKYCVSLIRSGFTNIVGRSVQARSSHVMTQAHVKASESIIGALQTPCNPSVTERVQRLLTPFTSLLTQVAGFKLKGRLKRRCKDCYIVTRQQRGYVICPTHPRHKQMSMKKKEKTTWILTHATQSKIRPY